MPSIFEPARQQELLTRLGSLTPETRARWGKFTATKMLAHVNDALRMALADLPVKAKRPSFLSSPLGRYLAIYLLPWPKGAPTAPELLVRCDGAEMEAERRAFKELVAKVGARKDATHWPPHPAFGAMSARDWGYLGYRHIHHHFTQFGV
jgi:hypothetical protein